MAKGSTNSVRMPSSESRRGRRNRWSVAWQGDWGRSPKSRSRKLNRTIPFKSRRFLFRPYLLHLSVFLREKETERGWTQVENLEQPCVSVSFERGRWLRSFSLGGRKISAFSMSGIKSFRSCTVGSERFVRRNFFYRGPVGGSTEMIS
ncbi:hypothetical protein CEXT_137521 [Caerostris extrusa]|uniref:Uncharacterized protein n=1 Tax=Caerostris extrusa TaxID=172846 RepID=A0AAV4RHH9_CAEEX|nr:hypothetical protein CEXT_137521 [Caerostris extrusa]